MHLFSQRAQMAFGEQVALEGLLALLRPALSLEIGTAEGGSLERIARHSAEVHTLDLEPRVATLPSNVTTHVGDSARTLPALLSQLTEQGRNVDFVLVDGDHEQRGVQRDSDSLGSSGCIVRTVIVFHDTANEGVRAGIASSRLRSDDAVVYANLDFVPSVRQPRGLTEAWGALGLVVVDRSRKWWDGPGTPGPALLSHDARDGLPASLRRTRRTAGYALRPLYRRLRNRAPNS